MTGFDETDPSAPQPDDEQPPASLEDYPRPGDDAPRPEQQPKPDHELGNDDDLQAGQYGPTADYS